MPTPTSLPVPPVARPRDTLLPVPVPSLVAIPLHVPVSSALSVHSPAPVPSAVGCGGVTTFLRIFMYPVLC